MRRALQVKASVIRAQRGLDVIWFGLALLLLLGLVLGGIWVLGRQAANERAVTARELAAIEALPEPEAKRIAMAMLAEKGLFECKGVASSPPLDGLPASVQDLFGEFEEVVRGEFWLGHAALGEQTPVPGLRKIGGDSEFEEIVVKPKDPAVYSFYGEGPSVPLQLWPSVWHRIIVASDRNVL